MDLDYMKSYVLKEWGSHPHLYDEMISDICYETIKAKRTVPFFFICIKVKKHFDKLRWDTNCEVIPNKTKINKECKIDLMEAINMLEGMDLKVVRMFMDDRDGKYIQKALNINWYQLKKIRERLAKNKKFISKLTLYPDRVLSEYRKEIPTKRKEVHKRKRKTEYYGVSHVKDSNRYSANISIRGTRFFLGVFDTSEEAGHVYDRELRKRGGSLKKLNFPNESSEKYFSKRERKTL